MSASTNQLLMWQDSKSIYLRVIGRAVAPLTPGLVELWEKERSNKLNRRWVLELSQCSLMDSTFSGQLARFALESPREKPWVLVNARSQVLELLDTLFVLDRFQQTDDGGLAAADQECVQISGGSQRPDRREISECCLEAHQTLVALHPENAVRFKELMRVLNEERLAVSK